MNEEIKEITAPIEEVEVAGIILWSNQRAELDAKIRKAFDKVAERAGLQPAKDYQLTPDAKNIILIDAQ